MLETIGKWDWLIWSCAGVVLGKYGRRYVENVLTDQDWGERFWLMKPLVWELINGLLWGVTAVLYESAADKIVFGLLSTLLLVIAAIDFCIYEIPPVSNGMIAGLGMIRIFADLGHWPSYITGSLLAGGIFLLVYLVTGKKGIGGGDIKLMAAAGLLLGAPKILYALFFGCVLAVLVQLPLKWIWKKNSTFALGPYLALGIGLMVWFDDKIVQWEYLLG